MTADDEAGIQIELEHGLQQLRHVSLVEFGMPPEPGAGARDVVLHPVVAAASRTHLRADDDPLTDAALIRRISVGLMATAIGQLDPEQPADWPSFVLLGPHVHALFDAVADRSDKDGLRDLIVAATNSALAHHSYGAVHEAMRLAEIALKELSRLHGDDEGSLWARHNLAWFLVVMDRPDEAEALYLEVLAIREQTIGPEHPDTLWTRHELAWLAASEGRWAAAEAAYRAVLEARRRALGDEHPDTLMAFHELGWVVANQGRPQEAEQMLTQVLAARCRVLGEEHHRTLWTRHELAMVIAVQGRWAEAESAYREVIQARRRLLRANHPDIATATQELAWTIASQGRHDDALELYQEVLTARQLVLGADHPDTAATAQAIERLRHGEITVPTHRV
jgi:tetratricopeptide (TPR) repeat protein